MLVTCLLQILEVWPDAGSVHCLGCLFLLLGMESSDAKGLRDELQSRRVLVKKVQHPGHGACAAESCRRGCEGLQGSDGHSKGRH